MIVLTLRSLQESYSLVTFRLLQNRLLNSPKAVQDVALKCQGHFRNKNDRIRQSLKHEN